MEMTITDAVWYLKDTHRWINTMADYPTEKLINLADYFWNKDKQGELFIKDGMLRPTENGTQVYRNGKWNDI